MQRDLQAYLLEIAREETAAKDAELQGLRNSLRYRVGGWMLEAFPPGRRTIFVLGRLAKLYLARRHSGVSTGTTIGNLALPEDALRSTTLVLDYRGALKIDNKLELWRTDNARLMALRLDSGSIATTLILRQPASEILRRLARAKLGGAKVVWWPESSTAFDPALVAYIRAHADECRDEVGA